MTNHARPIPKIVRRALTAKVSLEKRADLINEASWWVDQNLPKRHMKHQRYLLGCLEAAWKLADKGHLEAYLGTAQRAVDVAYRQRFQATGSSRLDQARFYLGITDARRARYIRQATQNRDKALTWGMADPQALEANLKYEIEAIEGQHPKRAKAAQDILEHLEVRVDQHLKDVQEYLGWTASKLRAAYDYRWERGTLGAIDGVRQLLAIDRDAQRMESWRNRVATLCGGKHFWYLGSASILER